MSRRRAKAPSGRMTYHEYIKSKDWENKKAEFKQNVRYREGRCWVCCNLTIEKHIHHLTYARLGREEMKDLRILCAVCHAVVHERSPHKLRSKWYKHASRNHFWGLRRTNPTQYAWEVAKFFGVTEHPFVVRVCRGLVHFTPVLGHFTPKNQQLATTTPLHH